MATLRGQLQLLKPWSAVEVAELHLDEKEKAGAGARMLIGWARPWLAVSR
jgi:hypothetical protein